MNLRVKESTDYFDIYSAQGHVLARIPKSIPDLPMTIAVFSHCLTYVEIVRRYYVNGHSEQLESLAEIAMESTKDVQEKYVGVFNN